MIGQVEGVEPALGHTLWEAWDLFLSERQPTERVSREWRRSLELFAEAVQAEETPPRSVEEISRDHVQTYARYLRARPSARGSMVSEGTVNKHVAGLRMVLEVALRNGWIVENPAAGAVEHDPRTLRNARRLPLLVSEIEAVQATLEGGSDDYWIWVLLRYTGATLREISNLHKEDVKKHENGVWYVRIHDADPHRPKPAARNRDLPLHASIAPEFCAWVAARPAGPLWPSCQGPAGSSLVSARLNRRIRAAGIDDQRKTLHSLRHSWAVALRYVCHDEAIRDALLGHVGVAVGRQLGDGPYLGVLAEVVNRVDPAAVRRLQSADPTLWQGEGEDAGDEEGVEEEAG